MNKKRMEIICNNDNYEDVIRILTDYKIAQYDNYSQVIPPTFVDEKGPKGIFGFWGFIAACAGVYLSVLFLYWTQKISYPLNIGGKDIFTFASSVPIIFEFSVLFLVVSLFILFLVSYKMIRWKKTSTDIRTISIEHIYNTDLLQSKLEPLGAVIRK